MSDNQLVKKFLEKGYKLTCYNVEQQNILGRYVGNLRSRIADLQKQGLTINHKMITVIKANGKKVFVAEYSMKAKVEQRHQLLNKPQLNLFA